MPIDINPSGTLSLPTKWWIFFSFTTTGTFTSIIAIDLGTMQTVLAQRTVGHVVLCDMLVQRIFLVMSQVMLTIDVTIEHYAVIFHPSQTLYHILF